MTFINGPLGQAGKTMIVQAINSGGDLSETQFDLMMAGGGMGIFNGLAKNGDEPVNPPNNPQPLFAEPYSVWGQRYGGVSSVGACNALPEAVQAGCQWRFADDGFMGADNPDVYYERVKCPAVLTNKSGCKLAEDA